jgi:hypothetical protein
VPAFFYYFIAVYKYNGTRSKKKSLFVIAFIGAKFCSARRSLSCTPFNVRAMGNCKISDDLKEAALRLRQDGQTPRYIKHITGISRHTLFRTQKWKCNTGSVAKAQAIGRGRPRSLLHFDAAYLLRLARHKPTLFLDEYAHRLEDF